MNVVSTPRPHPGGAPGAARRRRGDREHHLRRRRRGLPRLGRLRRHEGGARPGLPGAGRRGARRRRSTRSTPATCAPRCTRTPSRARTSPTGRCPTTSVPGHRCAMRRAAPAVGSLPGPRAGEHMSRRPPRAGSLGARLRAVTRPRGPRTARGPGPWPRRRPPARVARHAPNRSTPASRTSPATSNPATCSSSTARRRSPRPSTPGDRRTTGPPRRSPSTSPRRCPTAPGWSSPARPAEDGTSTPLLGSGDGLVAGEELVGRRRRHASRCSNRSRDPSASWSPRSTSLPTSAPTSPATAIPSGTATCPSRGRCRPTRRCSPPSRAAPRCPVPAGRSPTELVTRLVTAGVGVAPVVLHTGVSSLEGHEAPVPRALPGAGHHRRRRERHAARPAIGWSPSAPPWCGRSRRWPTRTAWSPRAPAGPTSSSAPSDRPGRSAAC